MAHTGRVGAYAERAAEQVLSLPMFPELTAKQCETVCAAVTELAVQDDVAVAS